MAQPERGGALEVLSLRVVVREGVRTRDLGTRNENAGRVAVTGESGPNCDGRQYEDGEQPARDEPSAAYDLAISRA